MKGAEGHLTSRYEHYLSEVEMKNSSRLWTSLLCLGILCLVGTPLTADESASYVPMAGYELLSLESQDLHSASAGGAILGKESTFVGLYSYRFFNREPAPSYPERYHTLDMLYDAGPGRSQIVALLKSESDEPLYGGVETFQAAAVYGYEVLSRPNSTLALGGGLAVADFGLDSPILPVPFVRLAHRSRHLDAGFDFITGPNLGVTLLPESHLQLRGDARVDQFRDIRDLIFEVALEYRFFDEAAPRDSYAGLSLGFKNDALAYTVGQTGEEYEVQYYALFGEVDLGILKITGGYALEGRERYGEDEVDQIGEGFFLAIQGLYMFSGARQ